MTLSQKSLYGLRAVFEIARRQGDGVATISEIAGAQSIPKRFLEGILNQLRGGGYLDSRRGKHGGYRLAKPAQAITVGEIIRLLEGPLVLVDCVNQKDAGCPYAKTHCVFLPVWRRVQDAMARTLDDTTIQDLLDDEKRGTEALSFNI